MTERYIDNKGITFWTEDFGNPSDPLVILVPGAASQGILWSVDFCTFVASKGFYVVRFDPRDTGLSTHVDFARTPYRMDDMAQDVLAIMDGYNAEKAHIVGTSMGGYIGQILAINYPDRVQSLTLLMSTMDFTPQVHAFMGLDTSGFSLPAPEPLALQQLKALFLGANLNDKETWLKKSLEMIRIFNGDQAPFSEEEVKGILELVFKRKSADAAVKSPHNHGLASAFGPTQFAVEKITCPTLIIHGSNDPIIPVQHAHATAAAIPHSEKFIIEGMGHTRSKVYDQTIVDRLVEFLSLAVR